MGKRCSVDLVWLNRRLAIFASPIECFEVERGLVIAERSPLNREIPVVSVRNQAARAYTLHRGWDKRGEAAFALIMKC